MPDNYGPFDESLWAEAQWFRHFPPAMPSGVIGTPATSATTGALGFASSGLTITPLAGDANVGGAGYSRTAPLGSVSATANANSTFSRRDRLVLRRSLATHTVALTVIQGTAAATPVAPAITRDATTFDLPLFSFLAGPNSSTALTSVVDERVWISDANNQPMVASMANRPTAGNFVGRAIRAADRPSVRYVYDGRIWVHEGLLSGSGAGLGSAPDGSYVTEQCGYQLTSTNTGGSGGFSIALPFPYSAVPLWTKFSAADMSAGMIGAVSNLDFTTSTALHGQAVTANGFVANSSQIRVLWTSVGYNT